jgi:hypothetical protein
LPIFSDVVFGFHINADLISCKKSQLEIHRVWTLDFGKSGFVIEPKVLYMSSSFVLLGFESRDFSQAEKEKKMFAKFSKFTK